MNPATALSAARQRALAVTGRVSMYRTVLLALVALTALALLLSVVGAIVSPGPGEILAALAVLLVSVGVVDVVAQLVLRLPRRFESSVITALILLFVLRPGLEPATLGGIALAGALAAASKYILVWRGRHLFNPAAVGAAIVTIIGWGTSSSWWVGTPVLAIPVVLLGLLVLWRTEKLGVAATFLLVAVATSLLRQFMQSSAAGLDFTAATALSFAVLQSPFLFLGAFMLSEPLTLPPRRGQQVTVAILVGVLAGWPISVAGLFTLGQERALLMGNLLAFAFAARGAIRLLLTDRRTLTDTTQELTFLVRGRMRFHAGQYLELVVPHRRPDARGTRREFSIVSAPSDLPTVRVAYRDDEAAHRSSYKRALAEVHPGAVLSATGVWGDFVLPPGEGPLLLVAAGIGITPFVSQLRERAASGVRRDIVLVVAASSAEEIPFREELQEVATRVVLFTPDSPRDLPRRWRWAGGQRVDAEGLELLVPDLSRRHALVSGPPRLLADLTPALRKARALTTDAFAGY